MTLLFRRPDHLSEIRVTISWIPCSHMHDQCQASLYACPQSRGALVQVTEEDLDSFEADYRGSEEETADLLKLYSRFKGNMNMVCQRC